MKLATAMHTNSFQIPFNFDFNLLKSSPITCPKNVPARFVLRSSHPLLSGGCSCARKYYSSIPVFSETVLRGSAERSSTRHNYSTITCARRTEREQDASTSPKEASKQTRLQLPDGIDETESLCDDNSSAVSGEANTRTADYASSLRTVGLCVSTGAEFICGQSICICPDLQVLPSAIQLSGWSSMVLPYDFLLNLRRNSSTLSLIEKKQDECSFLCSMLRPFIESSDILLMEDLPGTTSNRNLKDLLDADESSPSTFLETYGIKLEATPLLLTVAVIELSDIAFAPAIAVVLGFIGCKMILDFFGKAREWQ
ncbi:UNVERIFIED_CONTAM: hypothetical protein Sangu_1360200 [Sesamum angustifolium]|uniref:Uncharacterized protein n=1 Tax=Sesamum angustifolium TaxID=2727405 RepID=A0AAW2N7G2_9LAMI